MKRLGFSVSALVLGALSLGLISGCNVSNDNINEIRIRLVNVNPDGPTKEVRINDELIEAALNYGDVGNFGSARSGVFRIDVRPISTTTAQISEDLNAQSPESHTVLIVGRKLTTPVLQFLNLLDDRNQPGSGRGRLRVVNAAATLSTVDVYITGANDPISSAIRIYQDVPFAGVADYFEYPAGSYRVQVTNANDPNVVMDSGAIDVGSKEIRTMIIMDAKGAGAPYQNLILHDLN